MTEAENTTPRGATNFDPSTGECLKVERECLRLFRSQLADRNAMAPLSLEERLERGYRIAECARAILQGPPYQAPRWMRFIPDDQSKSAVALTGQARWRDRQSQGKRGFAD